MSDTAEVLLALIQGGTAVTVGYLAYLSVRTRREINGVRHITDNLTQKMRVPHCNYQRAAELLDRPPENPPA